MSRAADYATVGATLAAASRQLADSESPRLDAELLLSEVTGSPRSRFFAWPDEILSQEQVGAFTRLLQRRASGEPVAYIIGEREFWSLPLKVTPDTLIPRPETETLVSLTLDRLPLGSAALVADLGTGSGAVALAIASERPACRIIATDNSPAALEIARINAENLQIGNVEFRQGDWCKPLQGETPNVLVSNPPYIGENDQHLDSGDVRFEPRSALAAGPDGMNDLARITACAQQLLAAGGWLLLEHGYNQSDMAIRALQDHGFKQVRDHRDDSGQPRVVCGQK